MIALIAEAALRSLVLGALVWVAMLAIRPRNPHLQKTVWLTVLLASIAMPFALLSNVAPSIDTPEYLLSIAGAEGAAVASANKGLFGGFTDRLPLFFPTATVAYAMVTIALMVRFVSGFLRLSRIRREATPLGQALVGRLDVRVTRKLLSPATFGSTILLPEEMSQWSAEKLAAVLSHERAHVLNKDCYVLWIARLHASIFWFNPLAWWLNRRLADLAETTSDDAVIAAMSNRTGYADMLLEIARNPSREVVVTSAARANISARIDRIISNIPPAAPPRRWVRAVAIAVLIPPFTMAAATLQGPSQTEVARAGDSMPKPPADPMEPQVLQRSDVGDLEQFYPAEAKRMKREGLVTVEIDLDAQGNLVDARVVKMDPADEMWGFGPSALEVARRTTRFSNPTGKPAKVRLRVKFDLK